LVVCACRNKLSKLEWKYIIIDEAQRMKDRESKLSQVNNQNNRGGWRAQCLFHQPSGLLVVRRLLKCMGVEATALHGMC
jgi:hypothetical protein